MEARRCPRLLGQNAARAAHPGTTGGTHVTARNRDAGPQPTTQTLAKRVGMAASRWISGKALPMNEPPDCGVGLTRIERSRSTQTCYALGTPNFLLRINRTMLTAMNYFRWVVAASLVTMTVTSHAAPTRKAEATSTFTSATCTLTTPSGTTSFACDPNAWSVSLRPGETATMTATLNYQWSNDGQPLVAGSSQVLVRHFHDNTALQTFMDSTVPWSPGSGVQSSGPFQGSTRGSIFQQVQPLTESIAISVFSTRPVCAYDCDAANYLFPGTTYSGPPSVAGEVFFYTDQSGSGSGSVAVSTSITGGQNGWSGDMRLWSDTTAFSNPSSNLGTVSPVPEPSTYALMLAPLGVIALMARRRRPLAR
jgi:PEP-CTERM motif